MAEVDAVDRPPIAARSRASTAGLGPPSVTRVALLLVTLTGCDKLFDINHVTLRDGHVDDGADNRDGIGDTSACAVGHDEDLDNTDDGCDACPTVTSNTDDTDGDGLPNACDHDNGDLNKDRILAFWTFGTDDLSRFTTTGLVTSMPSVNNGMVQLGPSSSLTTRDPFAPKRIDFEIGDVTSIDFSSHLRIHIGTGAVCTFKGADCAGTNVADTCVQYDGLTGSTWQRPLTGATRITVMRVNMTNVHCEIEDASGSTIAGAAAVMPTGTVALYTTANAGVAVKSIVIYGSN